MKLAGIALAVGVALGTFGSGAAAVPVDISSGSAGFVNTPAASAFADGYTFTLPVQSTLTGIFASVVNGGQDVDFTSITLTGPTGPLAFSLVNPDPFEIWTISTPVLSAGAYTLTGVGTNSPAIGTYVGNIAVAASGVGPDSLVTPAAVTPLDISSGSAGFVNTPAAGAFTDSYVFTLTAAATLNGIVASAVNGGQDVDFSSLTLTGPSGPVNFALVNPDPFEIWTISTGVLSAGSYTLTGIGTNSASIGSYVGNIAVSVASVTPPLPEPESCALLLAGLGAMHFVMRRRKAR